MAMRISRRTVWQMTPEGYELLEEESYDYEGPVMQAKGGSSVAAPDPAVQANAEAAANRYNIVSPAGKQTYTNGPRQVIGYDSKGAPQYGTTQTQTTELSPEEQKQFDLKNQIATQLLSNSTGKVNDLSSSTFDYNNQGSQAAKDLFKRQTDLLAPEFSKADDTWEQRQNNAGIPVGSEAYNDSQRQHENDKNFALTQAAQQATGTGDQLALSQRQQNYNELAAALGSSQVTPINAFSQAGAPIDVAGAYANQNAANIANAQASNSSSNSLLGGIAGLGSAAITKWSDERMKEDIDTVGELPTGEGIYEYSYKADPTHARHVGVMAQEIERTMPEAVITDKDGMKKVDYRKVIARQLAA